MMLLALLAVLSSLLVIYLCMHRWQAPVSEQEELEMLREKVDVLEEELSINKARRPPS